MESEIEGVPDASNAQRTQVATTTQTYVRSASILEDLGEGKILDFGAGRGAGAEAIDADSYEPYPRENFVPTFTDSTDIPSGSYEKIISPSVLNVVPKDVRNGIVTEIGRILKEGGHAVITTRTVQDVKGAKFKKPHSSEENAFIVGKDESTATYQKGFSDKELREYLQQTLGDNFEVLPLPKAKDGKKVNGATALIRKKTQDAPSTPEPTPAPEAPKEPLKSRALSRAAYRIPHLREQFDTIDVEDGLLKTGSLKEVSETYDDAYIINEAKNRLDWRRRRRSKKHLSRHY
jgi:hypothetical protein